MSGKSSGKAHLPLLPASCILLAVLILNAVPFASAAGSGTVSTSGAVNNKAPYLAAVTTLPSTIDLNPGPSTTTVFCSALATDNNTAVDVVNATGRLYSYSFPNNNLSYFGVNNNSFGVFNNTLTAQSASVYTAWYSASNTFAGNGTYFSQPIVLNRTNGTQTLQQANWSWFESAGLTKDANGLGNDTVVLDLHFENDTKDASRFNNTGSLGNGTAGSSPVFNSSCLIGGCYNFAGNSNVFIPDSGSLDGFTSSGNFTVSLWMNDYNSALYIFDKGSGATDQIVLAGYSGTDYRFRMLTASNQLKTLLSSSGVSQYAWHHLAGSYDNSTMRLYIDGALNASLSLNESVSTANYRIALGSEDGFQRFFNGSIDEVHFWNRTLSASEISQLYSWEKNSTRGNSGFINNFTNVSLALRAKNFSFNDTGLVGWWDLGDSTGNETVTGSSLDLSGYNANGTFGNSSSGTAPTVNSTCVIGNCLKFNGGTQFINVTASPLFNIIANYTIAAWINPRVVTGSNHVILTKEGVSGTFTGYFLYQQSAEVYTGFGDGAAFKSQTTTSSPLRANAWQQVVVTWNGSQISTYVNGTVVQTSVLTLNPATNGQNLVIGQNDANGAFFDGLVDDVKIWNRSLSADEVVHLYNSGNPTNATGNETNWTSFTSEYYGGNASVLGVVGKIVQYRATFNSSAGANYSAFLQNVTLKSGYGIIGSQVSNNSCSLQGSSGNTVTANCSFALQYYFESGGWVCALKVSDALDAYGARQSSATVNSLIAIGHSPSTINYGSIAAGSNSSVQVSNVTNWGNVQVDAKFESTNLTSSGKKDINASNQWYSFSTGGAGSDFLQIPNSASTYNTTYDLAPSADGTATNRTAWFLIAIDSGQPSGTYSGVLTITATQG
ncbi:LamG domain-containing protein [Candidatus Micrarchaeota archaeon]|nr:LamG domain-containing protein [Candidatus Micrarchaeota archaeon]